MSVGMKALTAALCLPLPASDCRPLLLRSSVSVRGFPTIVYLSRGLMFPYSGSRQLQHLVAWARERRQRDELTGQGEAGQHDDGQQSGAGSGSSSVSQLSGLPVPPEPSLWQTLQSSFAGWAAELVHTLSGQPHVAVALLLMGALIGVALTVLLFALTLDGPSSGRARDGRSLTATAAGSSSSSKAAKRE